MFHCKFIESNNCNEAIFSFLTLSKEAGWTITSSSDGIAYSIEHSGTGINGLDNNYAWFVLHSPLGRELLFQRGKKSNDWWVSYSPKFGFKAGSTLNRPSAMDEGRLLHNNFGKPTTIDESINKWCFGIDDTSELFYFVALANNNNVCIFIAMDTYSLHEDSSALLFNTNYYSKYMLYFENGLCIKKQLDNWPPGNNYLHKILTISNGSLYDSMLYVDGILFPWTDKAIPTPNVIAPILIKPKIIPIKKKLINYKMIGKVVTSEGIKYHSWISIGEPDFTGAKTNIHNLTDIYIADKWKNR